RLLEMGIEPYQITSSLYAVVAQRLLRRRKNDSYQGRIPIAEWVEMDAPLRQAVLRRADAQTLAAEYQRRRSFVSLRESAQQLVRSGITNEQEVMRVLGPRLEGSAASEPCPLEGWPPCQPRSGQSPTLQEPRSGQSPILQKSDDSP